MESMVNADRGPASVAKLQNAPTEVHQSLLGLQEYLASQIVGQHELTERLLIALLADGHLLARRHLIAWVNSAGYIGRVRGLNELAGRMNDPASTALLQ